MKINLRDTQNEKKSNIKLSLLIIITLLIFILNPYPFVRLSDILFYNLLSNVNESKLIESDNLENSLRVFAKPPQTQYDKIIFYTDTDASIGDFVYTKNENIVGKIIEFDNNKKGIIEFFSSPSYESVVSVKNYVGTIQGQGAGAFYLDVPIDLDIEEGEKIILQESGDIVGHVFAIENIDESAVVKRIFSHLEINIFETSLLYVKN